MLAPTHPCRSRRPAHMLHRRVSTGTLSAVFTLLSGLHAGHFCRAGHRVEDILWHLMSKTFGSRGLGTATLPLR